MGLTAIRLNSDQTQHWYSLLQQRLKVYLHHLKGVYAFFGVIIIVLHSFLAQYIEPSIVYIFSFPVEIPLWQS